MAAKKIAEHLLDWYDRSHRKLPWRIAPGSGGRADPYRVWLSEIMLQQTTVAAVIPYFEAFTRRWPTVEALAAADDADVMSAWAGLGYYARARNLLACARAVSDGGFPDTEDGLRALPGVGPYTAAAIASIAFGRHAVVVDGNIERVVSRLFAVRTPLPASKPELRDLTAGLVPGDRPGDFAQAMMDLGAMVCRPKAPDCAACPLAADCDAAALGIAADVPKRMSKAPRPLRFANAYCVFDQDRLLLIRRPAHGLLGGMLALPASDFMQTEVPQESYPGAPMQVDWRAAKETIRHVFTHFELHMNIYVGEAAGKAIADAVWTDARNLVQSGLPTVFRKAAEAGLRTIETKLG